MIKNHMRSIQILFIISALVIAFGCSNGSDTDAPFSKDGPYTVGVTTLSIGDRDIEVWYPAHTVSSINVEPASYAAFDMLPPDIQALLPPEANLVFDMRAYRDIPVHKDAPFPVLTFSHGMGGFRLAYSNFLSGIASHGFVVASIDHLEWGMTGFLGESPDPPRTPQELIEATLSALETANRSTGMFKDWVDITRVATSGHSMGGQAAFALPDNPAIKAMIGYATFDMSDGVTSEKPKLLLVGAEDSDGAGSDSLEAAYYNLLPIKLFVSVGDAGHNSFTDQCDEIYHGNNFIQILIDAGFPIPPEIVELALDGCRSDNIPPDEFWSIAQHFTVAVLRYAFGIDDKPVGLNQEITDRFGDVYIQYVSDGLISEPVRF